MNERDRIAFTIYYENWLRDIDEFHNLEDMQEFIKTWKDFFIPSLTQPHCGDCTKVSCPCYRCITERHYKQADDIIREFK